MHPTYRRPSTKQGRRTFFHVQRLATKEPSSRSHKSSKRACRPRQKLKSEFSTSTAKKPSRPDTPTPMQTDNTTALGVVNNNIMKKLKSMDMKYHWLRCRINQRQFCHYWAAGKSNNGDYVTKRTHPSPNNTTNFFSPHEPYFKNYATGSKVNSPQQGRVR